MAGPSSEGRAKELSSKSSARKSIDERTRQTGRRPVTDIEAVAFAKALKVSVAWLLEETNDSVETPTK